MNSIESSLLHKVADFLDQEQIPPGSHFIVALSGGPDSTALLLVLNELLEAFGFSLSAAYVNHGMREDGELSEDDNFVHSLTGRLGVELHVKKVASGEIEKIATEEQRSSEEVARQIRYDFLNNVAGHYKNPYLLLGHNLDDQFETIITRFLQGTGFSGLKGIPHHNGLILRPLIHCRKEEILAFLKERRQDWRQDPTNNENLYLRNQVRNRLLPLISEIFTGYERSLSVQHERFSLLDNLLERKAGEMEGCYGNEKSSIPLNSFNRCDRFVRLKVLYRMFDAIYSGGTPGFRLPEAFFNPLVGGSIKKGQTFARAHGVLLYSDEKFLNMIPAKGDQVGYFALLENDELLIPGRYHVKKSTSEGIGIPVVEDSCLIFRSAAPGDYIETDAGRKPLKDIFSQWNLPHPHLNPPPVLEDSEGIAALIGGPDGYENMVRKKKIITSRKFNILYLEVGRV